VSKQVGQAVLGFAWVVYSMSPPPANVHSRVDKHNTINVISNDAFIAPSDQTSSDEQNEPKYVGVAIAVACTVPA
jgi:hypothetical protein